MTRARRTSRVGPWRRRHSRLGILSAAFVLLLSVTGVLLNHSAALRLDQRRVAVGWLLDWYGFEPAGEAVSYGDGDGDGESAVSWLDGCLFLAGRLLDDLTDRPVGAVRVGPVIAVGFPGEVRLFTPQGRMVDRLGDDAGVPLEVDRIGLRAEEGLVLEAGGRSYLADEALTGFVPTSAAIEVTWSQPAPVAAATREALHTAWLGRRLTLQRLLLDLHSGRFWGPLGVWLMDAMALIFVVLALSGAWLWWRRSRNGAP
jgi:hypothetical protein